MIKIYSFLEIKIIKLFINYVFKMNIFIKNVSEKIFNYFRAVKTICDWYLGG